MASIALIFGATLGTFAGLLGWLGFGMSLSAALGLYLAIGVAMPAGCVSLALLAGLLRGSDPQDQATSGPVAA